MKEIRFFSLLLITALFVQNASAALLLPYSSHYQGRSYFDNDGMTGFVEFAVYDTQYYNEWEGSGFVSPGNGQYIYAYQIFCDSDSSAIGSFSIMGIDPSHTLAGINTMSSQDPWVDSQLLSEEAIEPTDMGANPNQTQATWEFWGDTGAILIHDEYSWFLIFSSDNDWIIGRYEVSSSLDDGTIIIPNPEPCTVALLGIGSALLFRKRRIFSKSYKVHSHY
jgi:hypothetical protein